MPDHLVEDVDALVDVLAAARVGELVDEEVAEGAQVAAEAARADALDDGVGHRVDVLLLQQHLPQQAEEVGRRLRRRKVRQPLVGGQRRQLAVLVLDRQLQLLLRLLRRLILLEELSQLRREAHQRVRRPRVRRLLLDQRQQVLVPASFEFYGKMFQQLTYDIIGCYNYLVHFLHLIFINNQFTSFQQSPSTLIHFHFQQKSSTSGVINQNHAITYSRSCCW